MSELRALSVTVALPLMLIEPIWLTLPFAGVMLSTAAQAQALKALPATNPQAVALKYVADAKKGVGVKPGSNCANCALFQAATKGCSIFPGFAVAPAGWCSAWAKKA